jgi:hypothetical protein
MRLPSLRRMHSIPGVALAAAAAVALGLPAAAAPASVPRAAAPSGPMGNAGWRSRPLISPHPKTLAARAVSRPGAVPPGEEIVTATSDAGGYHLFAASAGDHWRWHALATLQPGGYSEEPWIGEQCLTGDGRYVVAVVAPWSAQNNAAGIAAGGIAYAVNAHNGTVRPLASGLLLAYFNPGCGSGSRVALSRYTAPDQSATQVLTADAATGAVTATPVIHDQVTSAVPVGRALYAAEGHRLVKIGRTGTASIVSSHGGQVFGLTPNAAGGVDYIAEGTAGRMNPAASVYRLADGRVRRAATGTLSDLRLLPGLNGYDTVAGAAARPAAAAQGREGHARLPVDVAASTSNQGSMAIQPGGTPGTVELASIRGTRTVIGALGPPAAPVRTLPPPPGARPGRAGSPRSAGSPATTPPSGGGDAGATCAVPRNDPHYQVPQPTAKQTDWALNLAGQGALPPRSDSYANLHTGSYDPSADFPLPAPFTTLNGIPSQIMEGIFAQESNWNQASLHAPPGLSGNPLIADYYGINSPGNTTGNIDFSLADCGYGLGQITDPMRLPAPGDQPTALQKRIAVDYAENAAATAQILADKWNALTSDHITIGDNNPGEIEDWYFAIWTYNSGINPQASTGGTGCTPGPGCTDSAGNWGLGWTNNPANATYDPQRHPFLHYFNGSTPVLSYGDAATPQNWPYQEKVFGWIESGQYEADGITLKYTPTYNYANGMGYFLHLPGSHDFCDSSDNCTRTAAQPCGYSGTGSLQWHCWWHNAAQVNFCGGTCHRGSWTYSGVDSEPAAVNPFPSVCNPPAPPSGLPGAAIVDDNTAETNLAGCNTPSAAGAMTWTPNTDSNGGPFGDVDLHQLGTGYGGRTMFTHLQRPSNSKWGGTMTWAPSGLDFGEPYNIKVFVPGLGAAGTLYYSVNNGGVPIATVAINQSKYSNKWVSLGTYVLAPGSLVTTTNVVPGGDGVTDVAFDAIAFQPMSTWTETSALNDLLKRLAGPATGPNSGRPMVTLRDDQGNYLDTAQFIQIGRSSYLAVYTSNNGINLATSADLVNWTHKANLDASASQPYLTQESNGTFLLADEKFDIPNATEGMSHLYFLHYASLADLYNGQWDGIYFLRSLRFFSSCNEGTPNIDPVTTSSTISFRFHWNANCSVGHDQEAYGTLSNFPGTGSTQPTATATEDTTRDSVVGAAGYPGKHGGRDDIVWHGFPFSIQEAQIDKNFSLFTNWRYVLYDYTSHKAYPVTTARLPITPASALCHGNPKFTPLVDPNGSPVLLVTGYVFGASTGCVTSGGREMVYTVPATGTP